MREDLVYLLTKEALKTAGWTVVAGQPSSGTDHLPVVEIKEPMREGNGSLGAFKPDLIAWHHPWLAIGECKPKFDEGDVSKLRNILSSQRRLDELRKELALRGLPGAEGTLVGFVAYETPGPPLPDLGTILCSDLGADLIPAGEWPPELRHAFRLRLEER